MGARRIYKKQPYETGIYHIKNSVTGKYYIGSSIELSKRMGRHLWGLRKGIHHSLKLQRSFDKHGEVAFEFKILLVCEAKDVEMFETRAIHAYDSYQNGYNVAPEAKGGFMRGRKWPERTKEARVEAMRGRTHTEESKARIREGLAKLTEEEKQAHRDCIGAANRKPKSEKGKKAIIQGLKKRYESAKAHEQTAEATRNSWAARREKYGPTGRKPKNSAVVSCSEEVIYG